MDTTIQQATLSSPTIVDVEDAFCVQSGRTLTMPVQMDSGDTSNVPTPASPVKRKQLIKSTDLVVSLEEEETQFVMEETT
jgi:hypothetical protein